MGFICRKAFANVSTGLKKRAPGLAVPEITGNKHSFVDRSIDRNTMES